MTTWTRPDLRKLTPILQAEVVRMLEFGLPVRWAAEAAGISHVTHYDWVSRGNEWLDGEGNPPETERPFIDYANATRKAIAEGKARWGVELFKLASDDSISPAVRSRVIMFYLTHADRDHWHPKHAAEPVEEFREIIEVVWPE